jgi:hypothetical protein
VYIFSSKDWVDWLPNSDYRTGLSIFGTVFVVDENLISALKTRDDELKRLCNPHM